MSERKLIVFDFDGTLVDAHTELVHALKEFSEARNLPYDGEKMALGYTNPKTSDLGWGIPLEQQEAMLEKMGNFYFDEMVTSNRFMPTIFPYAKEVLEELYKNYDLVIITARDRRSLDLVLKHYDLAKYFKGYRSLTCARERGYPIKPQPDAVHCLLKDTNHTPDNIVVIGDTTSDIGMANNAGAKSIAALWGVHPAEKLAQEKPTIMLENLIDLPQAVKEIFEI